MSRDATIPRWAAGVVVLAALVAGACGSGATEGPGDDTEAAQEQGDDDGGGGDTGGDGGGGDDGRGGGEGGGGGGGDRYSWNLPVGDISPDAAIDLYNALRTNCDEGETAVETAVEREKGRYPDELLQLYRAAIAICRGDVEGGRELYRGAGTSDDFGSACLVREAVLSVLEQRPQNISACPYDKIATTSTSEEETTTTAEDETTRSSTEGEETTTTPSTAAGGEPAIEPGGEVDDGA